MRKRIRLIPGKLFLAVIILLLLPPEKVVPLQYDCTRDYPLFDYRAEGNRLPWGDYVMIRSFRETTQILVCRNYYHVTIYTDRNNLREGYITASKYTELGHIISSPGIPTQLEFDTMLREYALNGLSMGGKILLQGINHYMEKIDAEEASIDMFSNEYLLKIKEGNIITEITVDARWKKLVIRQVKGKTEVSSCPSVYIDQTLDKTLRRIITEFAYKIRKTAGS